MRFGHRQRPRLRLALHGMSERNLAMLKLLFQGPDWQDCEIVGNGPADLGIVDLDSPSPDRDWDKFRHRHPELPALVMSLRDQSRENAWLLRKPFDAAALRKAIDQVRDNLARPKTRAALRRTPSAAQAATTATPTTMTAPPAAPVATRKAAAAFDHEMDERNCGQQADVDLASTRAAAKIVYDPPGYFQGVLEHAIRQAREGTKPVAIAGLPAAFVVLPGRAPVIVTPLKDSVLRSVCVLAMKPGSLRVLDAQEIDPTMPTVPADALVWQVALWTARGRLRRGIGLDSPQRLARWPDFTRQTETPHAMRLAAILVGSARTPRELCSTLEVPQRYVFSLLSAAASVGLLQRRAVEPADAPAPDKPRSPGRSLLARILGRLVPGQ
jgi:hypothetical protein